MNDEEALKMRVIAGKARSLVLKTIEGMDTRPTTDRIKETLFNMIGTWLPGCEFLDLFAGSGAIGIEALSRGASRATFVENNPAAAKVVRENLTHTRLNTQARMFQLDVFAALTEMGNRGYAFDIIFMDPPYNQLLEKKVLEHLSASSILAEDAVIIVEASLETDFSYADALGYEVTREKEYKTNKHVFLKKKAV